jgi:hypothetical protein
MIIAIITLLILVLIMVAKQTIKTSRLESPVVNHPIVEDEVHLFAERPHHPEKGEGVLKVDQKNIVITELMVNGTIDFARAKELGIKRLAGVIFRLRKHYKIDNVIVDGKFSHYKLIKYKGN